MKTQNIFPSSISNCSFTAAASEADRIWVWLISIWYIWTEYIFTNNDFPQICTNVAFLNHVLTGFISCNWIKLDAAKLPLAIIWSMISDHAKKLRSSWVKLKIANPWQLFPNVLVETEGEAIRRGLGGKRNMENNKIGKRKMLQTPKTKNCPKSLKNS